MRTTLSNKDLLTYLKSLNFEGGFLDRRKVYYRPMVCLATDPKDKVSFHVACYHSSLDPFMARGRELRLKGASTNTVDSVRAAEGKSGRIPLPKQGGALWQVTCPWSAVHVAQVLARSLN